VGVVVAAGVGVTHKGNGVDVAGIVQPGTQVGETDCCTTGRCKIVGPLPTTKTADKISKAIRIHKHPGPTFFVIVHPLFLRRSIAHNETVDKKKRPVDHSPATPLGTA